MFRIIETTDGKNLGVVLNELPTVGSRLLLKSNSFLIESIKDGTIVSSNYIIRFEDIGS